MCSHHTFSFQEIQSNLSKSYAREAANARKGLLVEAPLDIPGCFEMSQYSFLKENPNIPDTVHPNLWAHARLNMNVGLFRVNRIVPDEKPEKNGHFRLEQGDVFQLRGYDLANMTIVYDGISWIVMDVLTTKETAGAAWEQVVRNYLSPSIEIGSVVYSHSHIDHYGGIEGLKPFFKETCEIIAPKGFTEHAVSENIYAGTAMSRRAVYQYGSTLPVSPSGQVDCGLGKAVAKGSNGILTPQKEISEADYGEKQYYEWCSYSGLRMQFQYTPGTEAPAEMNVYLPDQKLLFIAENCAGTLHNALTPRGAQVRDLLAWANYLDATLLTFPDMEILCAAHNWPRWSQEECVRFIEVQRDMYRYINNTTLHLVNLGYTLDEVGRMLSGEDGTMPIPEEFANEWCCHGFYGTFNHNAKAVYQRYIGWYDSNPAHLNRHKPADRADRYMDAFGASAIAAAVRAALEAKDYAWAAELSDLIMNAAPEKTDDVLLQVRTDYVEALRQMGYQSEASTWRNMYLTAALEIAMPQNTEGGNASKHYLEFPDSTIQAMSLEMMLQYMGIMLDSRKVEADRYRLTMEITSQSETENKGQEFAVVRIQRGVLHYRIVEEAQLTGKADIQVCGRHVDLFRYFIDQDIHKKSSLCFSAAEQTAAADDFISSYLTRFSIAFPIMTPRKDL